MKVVILAGGLPGENRQLSIYSGLCRLKEVSDVKDAIVLIQDAARPNTSLDTISRCFALAEDEDGVHISGLLDRKTIFAGQAPESFRLKKYLAANEALLPEADLKRFCEQFK